MKRFLAGVVVIGTLVLLLALVFNIRIVGTRDTRERSAASFNVLLISLDTLRADELGVYGGDSRTSPTIDALAQRSLVFGSAVAESSWTLPSHVSMLSGMHPLHHGVVKKGTRIPKDTRLIAELLKAHQYRTFAYTDGGYVNSLYGFNRGFERYRDGRRPFSQKISKVAKQISLLEPSERFFVFLHTYEIHCPYHPPAPYYTMFSSEGSEPIETEKKCGNNYFNKIALAPGQVEFLRDRYRGAIRRADDDLKVLFDILTERNLWSDTIVILTSDHGEEFWEHGQIGHQASLHRELLHIPLIIYHPLLAHQVIDHPVGLIDIVPTVLSMLDIPTHDPMDGKSLLPLLRAEQDQVAENRVSSLDRGAELRSVMNNDWHLILEDDASRTSLYNVREDPREQRDLAASNPDQVSSLRAVLENFSTEANSREEGDPADLPQEHIEQLRSLGYID